MFPTLSTFTTDDPATNALLNATHTLLSGTATSSVETQENATESDASYEKHFSEYDIFRISMWLFRNNWKIVTPPGLFGNIIILIVTLKMKPFNSTSLFMVALAIVDILVICFRIPVKEVPHFTSTLCQSLWYLYNALPLFSNYILLLWTIERFIAVQFPLRVMEWVTEKRTAISIVVAGVFSFSVHIAWPMSIIATPAGRGCIIHEDKITFIYEIWYKVDTAIFIYLPMIVIFLCNITIIYRLQQSTKRHKQMTCNEESRQKREKEQRNTTITLLSVSFAFLILHTPLAVHNSFAMSTSVIMDQEAYATWNFINVFGLTLMELQNSVNFYLYFLSGRRYRQVTYSLFVSCRKARFSMVKMPGRTTMMTGVSKSTDIN